MRKLAILWLWLSFLMPGRTQICVVNGSDYAGNFILCANNISTTSIFFGPPPHPSGYGTVSIVGTSTVVDLSGITVNVPDKITLVFSGNILIDAGTKFQGSGGNAEVRFGVGGTVYKANGNANSRNNNFDKLNALIISCAANPNPFECVELAPFLPVELTRFVAQTKGDRVELGWTTATELNNDFFEVEHSRDGLTFAAVGKVKGAGTSSQVVDYQFTHRQPVPGANYYRLKQVDYDGTFNYSDLIALEVNRWSAGVQIYPNPTLNTAVIRMQERPERINFQLSNLLGQGINLQPRPTDDGWEIDLSGLVKGIYILRMEYAGRTLSRRVVKE